MGVNVDTMPTACGIQELMDEFDVWMDPSAGIETQQKLLTHVKKKGIYNQPLAHTLGKRWEVRYNRQSKKHVQMEVDDMLYYVRIESTLKVVLRHPVSWNLMDTPFVNDDDNMNEVDIMEDWLDAANGSRLKEYCRQKFPTTTPIFLQLYFDEAETVNPLGSKTGIHKLAAFYFTIKNFPPWANSALHNIHLWSTAHADDVKKYGIDAIVRVFVSEMQQLHDDGCMASCGSSQRHFRCKLTQVVGDNLGLHSVLGYMENFNRAGHPCDLCLTTQADLRTMFDERQLTLKTPELYDQHIKQLQNQEITNAECGIKRATVLSSLPYYHPARNDSVDIMHHEHLIEKKQRTIG